MMRKMLLTLALLAVTATTADAADRWCRSSFGTRNSGSNSYGTRAFLFPQQNTIVIQQDTGYGSSVFSSGPLVQYGTPTYQPYQSPFSQMRRW